MNAIINFFSDTLIMDWLFGTEILELFNNYFISQSDANQVLIIIGVAILSVLGAIRVVKEVLKLTLLWVKIIAFIALTYYLFVVVLGIDVWGLIGF